MIEKVIRNITFQEELEHLINRYSMENGSNTPDYILAEYLNNCLKNFDRALTVRNNWYGSEKSIKCSVISDDI